MDNSGLLTSSTAILIAVIGGYFTYITYRKSSAVSKSTEDITKIIANTKTPVQDLLSVVEALQADLDKQRKRYEREIKFFQDQLEDLRDENAEKQREINKLNKIIVVHERRLNQNGINGVE